MLIDEWVHTTEIEVKNPHAVWGDEGSPLSHDVRLQQAQTTLDAMKQAQNFVASPLIIETASSLGRDLVAIERSAGHLFLPAEITWLDLTANIPNGGVPGARQGVLLIGTNGSIQKGEAMWLGYLRRAPGHETDWGDGGFAQLGFRFDLARGVLATPVYGQQHTLFRQMGGNLRNLAATIWSTIALINTRRVADVHDADLSKINRARHKMRRPPILQYKVVTLKIDREMVRPSRGALTREMPMHHVRAFLRIRRGKVELVRPHWRGNPRFGIIVHRYVAVREEDEAGPWSGGPMPPNEIL